MITPELLQYIREQLALGKTVAEISTILASQGWTEADIKAAFSQVAPTPPLQNTQFTSVQPDSVESWRLQNILDFKHMKWYEWLAFLPTIFLIINGGMIGAVIGLLGWGVILYVIRKTTYSKFVKIFLVLSTIVGFFVLQTVAAIVFTSLVNGLIGN